MFFNADMLTKRGPLARVWMASHLSSKISKSNLLQASIPASVAHIVGDVGVDMALRLSSQLLLGVSRIYQRKAGYLLDDCREVLGRVKKAFRPAAVDMTDADLLRGGAAARDAITLRHEQGGLDDILAYDAGNWNTYQYNVAPAVNKAAAKNVSNRADITLPDPGMEDWDYGAGGFMNYADPDSLFDLGQDEEGGGLFDMDEVMGNTGVDKGKKRARNADESGDEMDDPSVELGRDAAHSFAHASARGSVLGGAHDLDLDDAGLLLRSNDDKFDAEGFDLGLEEGGHEADLGGMDYIEYDDYGGGGDAAGRLATPDGSRMGSVDTANALGLTPKTAANLAAKATPQKAKAAADGEQRAAKRQKVRAQIVDKATELEWQHGARNKDKENLFVEPTYLPASKVHMALLEMESNPTKYYLPRVDPKDKNFEFAAMPRMPEEIAALCRFPTRRQRIMAARGGDEQADNDQDVELGRRAMTPAADLGGMDYVEYDDYGGGGPEPGRLDDDLLAGADGVQDDTFQFDDALATPNAKQRKNNNKAAPGSAGSATTARRHAYLFEELEQVGRSEGPLAVFDESNSSTFGGTAAGSAAGSSSQAGVTHSLDTAEEDDLFAPAPSSVTKLSKNTTKAIAILADELADEPQVVFDHVAEKATKRAASTFFFELLVLSTKNIVQVKQDEAFGDIKVQAKQDLAKLVAV